MKRRLLPMAGALFATVGLTLTTAAPSWATFEVNPFHCNFTTEDWTVFSQRFENGLGARRCYADAGDLWFDLHRVDGFSSGNNAGYFEYEPGDGYRYRHNFPKWENKSKWYGTVFHVHID